MTGNAWQVIAYLSGLSSEEREKEYELTEKKHKRSLNANNLLWKCLDLIAQSLRTDKFSVYLQMLKRYGRFTYVIVKPEAVESMKAQWRETEVLGDIEVNGKKAVQLICYYGSSTLNTKEFSVLLEGVLSEMSEMGLKLPPSDEVQALLAQWEVKK